MNFVVSSSTLLKHLQIISGALTTNSTLAILDNFLFDINNDSLEISASDLETTMKTNLAIESKEKAIICVPSKMLLDILKTLPEQPLTFNISQDNFAIEISYSNGKSKMVGFDGNEFPKIKEMEATKHISIDGNILQEAITKTIFATGTDELRPVMGGVFCQFDHDGAIFVATDAHKLVRYKSLSSKTDEFSSFILPKKALNLLKNGLGNKEEKIDITFNETNAIFQFSNIELTCRLVDGKYPNYEAVIPLENNKVLTIDRVTFLNSLKRVSIFANKTSHQVAVKISGSELSISARDDDFYNEANERLTCSYEGEDIQIGFNSRFIIEMLSNLETEMIQLKMSQPNKAGIIFPVETEDNIQREILMLVMPVMI